MLVGPSKAMFMDGISTGLDSSTTFQIVKYMRQFVHIMDGTMLISLLQPAPETYELFDDVILLSEGHIVYQGPREDVIEFFEFMGFRCPERKGVADFLQEVMSKKDQQQYWRDKDSPYRYISAEEFSQAFSSFRVGQQIATELRTPFDKSKSHPAALETTKYGISSWDLFKACFAREWLLMKRNAFVYIFKTTQITFMSLITMTVFLRTQMKHETFADGQKYFGALFFSLINVMFNGLAELALTVVRLPVFYRQRDFLFYPSWAFALPIYLLRIPLSILESGLWIFLTYYTVGFAPSPSRCFKQFLAYAFTHQMGLGLFRFLAAVGRTLVISNTIGIFTLLVVFTLGGFVVSKDEIKPWWIWGYWSSPMMYGQTAIALNEFLDERWSKPNQGLMINAPTLGTAVLKSRGMPVDAYWYWICIGALAGFSLLFNICFVLALKYLNPLGNAQSVIPDEEGKDKGKDSRYLRKQKSKPLRAGSWSADPVSEGTNMDVMDCHGSRRQGTMTASRGMVLPFQPLSLAFDHVNYYVDMPAEMKNHGFDETRLQLLHDVSGAFRPGVLTALVGVSGAGKTTLMDVLAGRKTGGYIEGSINISGYQKKQETFARVSGYCEQEDIHSPNLTVHESLIYSSWLRLSAEVNSETREMFVEEVMELVELDSLKNALVGLPGVDGLSTEQRKRLTIAVELVANPSIIFMDEPTTGLDARAAAIVMRTVRNTVDTGRTVVCTIHQPSIDIFEAFDELLLMKRGGQTIYAGPLGHNSDKLIEFFEAIPGVPEIRDGQNPATWMLEVTSASIEAQLNVDFAEIYANSSLYRSTEQQLVNLVGSMYSAVMFLGASNAMAVLPIVSIERTVMYREKAAGMYSSMGYAIGQVGVEVLYIAVQTIIFTLILFPMINFVWIARNFIWFFFFMFTSFIYFTLYGMMAVALTPGDQIGAIVMSFFLTFWNLFSGFLITRPAIPIWWRWYYWGSPVAWTIYGLITSQLGDLKSLVVAAEVGLTTVKQYLETVMGYKYDFLGFVAVAHLAFDLVFLFIFAFCIRFLNFQKR
ncbi:ABC transporter G family member 39 [Nymphaea thermarum]|nr:ABC transporter G family member 39 [Nymphaea thermarum]